MVVSSRNCSSESMPQSHLDELPNNIDSQDPQRVELSQSQTSWLLFSVLIVALCGIAYELIIAAVSSYLLGNSVAQFSITIGLFMFSMGIGSYLSKFIANDLVFRFVQIEVAVALVGGLSATLLFLVFPYFGLYHAVMYLLTLVIGILVGLEIPILTRILTGSGSVSESLAHVLSLDYLGALIGSVGFPLLLLPRLGLFRSSFGIGILNIAIAGLAIIVLGKNCASLRSLRLLVLLTAGILIVGLVFSAQIARYAEGMLFADEVIYQEQSPYQRIVFTKNARNGELRLYLDGHLQFAESDEYRYHESLVHPAMSCGGIPKRILVLGGGDGLAIREVLKHNSVERIDLVDIDPQITALAQSFGPLRALNGNCFLDTRVHIHSTDAFSYVLQYYRDLPDREPYDRIVVDLPDPHNEALNKLYSREFYKLCHRVLSNDGAMVTQSGSPIVTREAFWSIHATLVDSGFRTLPYRISLNSFGEWGFQLAVKAESGVDPQGVRLQPIDRQYLSDEVFQYSQCFSLDTERLPVPVNTIFEPKLYLLYEKGVGK
jgi:spermidine synthase